MEKISEILINNWVAILVINALAVIFIIGYLIERNSNKQKNNNKKDNTNKIIFDNET